MRSESEIRKEQAEDLRKVMGFPEGRRLVLRILDDVCCVGKSVMRSNPMCHEDERLVYNGAKQDVGHWLRDEVTKAAPLSLDLARGEQMARESMEKGKKPEKKAEENGE